MWHHVILMGALYTVALASNDKIKITTALGDIIGNVHHEAPQKVYEFLGIQYGISPLGNLRFRPSQLNTSWNTTYDATTYGPICIQPDKGAPPGKMDEDCLYLNIWTSQIDKTKKLLPVLFWIHGGGFIYGAGSDPSYDGTKFVGNAGDFVLVTINYRLGPLGFLQSKQLYDEDSKWKSYGGMNGIYDQINALSWTKQYISDFGGDPNHITIFGESAGGLSVCYLLISPMVPKNAFQRALIQSGSCIGHWGPHTITAGINACNLELETHAMSTNINQLRKYPADRFKFTIFQTSVDALVITELPSITYTKLNNENTAFNTKELIMGFNSMDGITGYPWGVGSVPTTPTQYNEYVNRFIKNKTQAHLIETVYYPLSDFPAYLNHTNASLAWESMNGDVCVACPTIQQMRQITKQKTDNDFTGYIYEFRGGGPPYYAPHASEIPFIYDHPTNESFFSVPWNQTLSDSMLSSWTNYGKYGIPNVTTTDNNIEWKQFTLTSENVIVWDNNIRIESNYPSRFRHDACDFWYNEVGVEVMGNVCSDI